MKYSLPYTKNIFEYLTSNEEVLPLIEDIFFSDDAIFPSSRLSQLHSSEWEEITKIKGLGVKLNYVLNPTVWDNKFYTPSGKIDFIKNILKLRKLGIDAITINNTMLLRDKDIRKSIEGLTVKNSVNNMVVSLDQVMFYVEELKLSHIFLGRDINRNLDEIKKISDYAKPRGVVLHALANEFCFSKCAYKLFCDSLISQIYKNPIEFDSLNSKRKTLACGDNWEISKYLKCGVIYPQQIPVLSEYIDILKLGGRLNSISSLKFTLDAYLKGTDTSLSKLINQKVEGCDLKLSDLPKAYFEKTLNCKNQCHACKYCDSKF